MGIGWPNPTPHFDGQESAEVGLLAQAGAFTTVGLSSARSMQLVGVALAAAQGASPPTLPVLPHDADKLS